MVRKPGDDRASREKGRHENNVIEISEYQIHLVSEVVCLKCLRRWISVRPECVFLKDIECPACGAGYVIETGEYFGEEEND